MTDKSTPKNILYYGDNLEVLRKYIKEETVDLCYIDPPFNSKRNYNQIYNNTGGEDRAQAQAFVDTWEWNDQANEGLSEILANNAGRFSSQTVDLLRGLQPVLKQGSLFAYLVSMTLRITEIHRVLKSNGSFYLHCDPTASHYLKLVLDAIFLPSGGEFQNEIIWHYKSFHGNVKRYFPRKHDTIFLYCKGSDWIFNRQFNSENEDTIDFTRWNSYLVDGYKILGSNMPMQDTRFVRFYKRWVRENEREPEPDDVVYEVIGQALDTVWDIKPVDPKSSERLGYPTQKPEALLERIIKASSNEGDVVLDAYCGCGTTIAVAEKLKRKWIGIDITYQSISLILRRLEAKHGKEVLNNVRLNGIPQDMASAKALAAKQDDRLRKEFEKWAVLTYTNNRAIINDKKGADQGIDGIAYFLTGKTDNAKIVFQVKSGKVERNDVSTLNSDRIREGAELAVLLTLLPSTKPMRDEANAVGVYEHELMNRSYPRIQIVTIAEIVEQHKRLDIPMSLEVLKKAQTDATNNTQTKLFTDEE